MNIFDRGKKRINTSQDLLISNHLFIIFINFLFYILISYLDSYYLFIFSSSFYFLYFFFVSTILVGCEQDIDEKPIKAKRLKPVVDPVPEDPSSGWWTASKK